MTREEAIKFFKKFRERICKDAAGYDYITCRECDFKNDCDQKEAFDLAISILSADGDLISQFRDYQIEWLTSHNDIDLKEAEMWVVQFLKDTAECFVKTELPSAEKTAEARPMQVELEADGYADGELVYDYGKCPNCGWEFEDGDKDWEEPYCCHCGQKLKWFETEEGDTYED